MITTVSDACFPRPVAELEQLASYYDDHDTSLEMGNREQMPCAVEQDEDGFWCASIQLRPGVAAFGEGATREAALDDLRTAFDLLLSVIGPCP
jgi:predicted RNase H-like HicB family nuclease